MNTCLCGYMPEMTEKKELYRVICRNCGRTGAKSYKEEIAKMVWNESIDYLAHRTRTNTL